MLLPLCHMLPSAVCVCLWVSAFNFLHPCLSVNNMADPPPKKGYLFYAHLLRVVCDMLDFLVQVFFPCNSCLNLLPKSMLQVLHIYVSVYTCTCTDAFPIKVYLSFIQTQGIFGVYRALCSHFVAEGKGGPVKDLSLLFSLSQPPGPKPEIIWHCWLAVYLETEQLMVKVSWRLLAAPASSVPSSCTGVEGLVIGQ